MAKRRRPADPTQLAAFDTDAPRRRRGRVERGVDRTVRTAVDAGDLDPERDAALIATMRATGRALDDVDRESSSYVAGQLSRVMVETLDAAGLMPRGTTTDALAALFSDDTETDDARPAPAAP